MIKEGAFPQAALSLFLLPYADNDALELHYKGQDANPQ